MALIAVEFVHGVPRRPLHRVRKPAGPVLESQRWAGTPQPLVPTKGLVFAWSFSADGKRLAYTEQNRVETLGGRSSPNYLVPDAVKSWYDLCTAFDIFPLTNGRYEIRCAPGDIVHVAFNPDHETWSVEEDPERQTFRTLPDAVKRARIVGRDPDFS